MSGLVVFKYILTAVYHHQQHNISTRKEAQYPLEVILRFSLPTAPGNYSSTFCPCESVWGIDFWSNLLKSD